jgi:dihydrofolate reductase
VREEYDGDIGLGGATLAASFIRRRLVDEYQLVVHPVVLGSGTPYMPPLDSQLRLRLVESHVFSSGVTYLAYRPAGR